MGNDEEECEPAVDRERIFGARVKQLRLARSWTQEELARRLVIAGHPMHQTMVAKIESGTRPTNVGEIASLADIFGLQVATLFDLSEEAQIDLDLASLYRRKAGIQVAQAGLRAQLVSLDAEYEDLQRRCRDLESEAAARRTIDKLLPYVREPSRKQG